MKQIKSERLRKLESELNDLDEWLKLGLVPKKDISKHKDEIIQLKSRIEEEKERLQFLKEGGDAEEFIAPKRIPQKGGGYSDMPTIPDIEMAEGGGHASEGGFDAHTYVTEGTTFGEAAEDEECYTVTDAENAGDREEGGTEEEKDEEEEDESYFSDRNRWKRGGIVDPDANEW